MKNAKEVATYVYRTLVLIGLLFMANQLGNVRNDVCRVQEDIQQLRRKVDSLSAEVDTLKSIHPWKQVRSKKTSYICKEGTFFGFILYTPVDTSLSKEFKTALANYTGPQVKVNSLRRAGSGSRHCCGNAADLELTPALVEYLTSPAGECWLSEHKLSFMIEGKPGSRKVKSYQQAGFGKWVFFNPKASGDHVHLAKVKNA